MNPLAAASVAALILSTLALLRPSLATYILAGIGNAAAAWAIWRAL